MKFVVIKKDINFLMIFLEILISILLLLLILPSEDVFYSESKVFNCIFNEKLCKDGNNCILVPDYNGKIVIKKLCSNN